MEQYVSGGAVLGYGTTTGGKMVSTYEDDPTSEYYYVYYYDDHYEKTTAISKIEENNLKQIASDLGIDYIHMSKTSNLKEKISEIKKQIAASQTTQEKVKSYQDIYYYFAIPFVILLIVDFIMKKRRIQ